MNDENSEAAPKVSVIIPAYNSEQTLPDTIRSLQRQTTTSWQAIIVDDGSEDETSRIIAEAVDLDPRIIAEMRAHGGVSCARNAGLYRAEAEWIVFLDSDDTLPDDHLQAMLDTADARQDAELLHAGWRRIARDGAVLTEEPAVDLPEPFVTTAFRCPFAIHAAMTRRTGLLEIGGFDPELAVCEDWDLWQRLARTERRFVTVPDRWVEVRVRPGSVSGDTVRLLVSGLANIERAFAPDPRVGQASTRFAEGLGLEQRPAAIGYHALWNLGNVIGSGAEIEAALRSVAILPIIGAVDLHRAATTLIDGILVGAKRQLGAWIAVWPLVERSFRILIDWLDKQDHHGLAGSRLQFAVEKHVAYQLTEASDLSVGALRIMTLELTRPITDLTLDHVTRLKCRLEITGKAVGEFETLVCGVLPAGALAELVREHVHEADLDQLRGSEEGSAERTGGFLRKLLARHSKELPYAPELAPLKVRSTATADPRRAIIESANAAWPRADKPSASSEWVPPDFASENYWESVFATRDPWEYDNSYEVAKYHQTLSLVPEGVIRRALEIACAEGRFTRLLAPRVEQLLATDISQTAVERASATCFEHTNIEFQKLDLARDPLPGIFDLIVCSEVLYYLEDSATLGAFARKVSGALSDGGRLLLAHGNLIVDEPDRTGFPWPHPFGAKGIGEAIAAASDLQLEREMWTPLYRIQLFRQCGEAIDQVRELADTAKRLPPRVAGQVKWRGVTRLPPAETWNPFPILMYHRISDEGPEALSRYRVPPARFERQMQILRDSGWTGISMRRLEAALSENKPLPPKSVMLTFDDAYVDFLDHALPRLHRHGFPATLFVPTLKAGQASDWDAAYGAPASILSWTDLGTIRHCDVTVGSHGQSHRSLPALSCQEQLGELAGSRAELAFRLDQDISSIAYPYGEQGGALADAAKLCGYTIGMTCDYGWVSEHADPLRLPRVEIAGDLDDAGFAALFGIEL